MYYRKLEEKKRWHKIDCDVVGWCAGAYMKDDKFWKRIYKSDDSYWRYLKKYSRRKLRRLSEKYGFYSNKAFELWWSVW